MRVIEGGSIWAAHALGAWAVVPTNTQRRSDGTAVMGAGLAKAAAHRYPELEAWYGAKLASDETRVRYGARTIALVPTKIDWKRPSTVELVTEALDWIADAFADDDSLVAIPALGCGLGGLDWSIVRPLMESKLAEDRFLVFAPFAATTISARSGSSSRAQFVELFETLAQSGPTELVAGLLAAAALLAGDIPADLALPRLAGAAGVRLLADYGTILGKKVG